MKCSKAVSTLWLILQAVSARSFGGVAFAPNVARPTSWSRAGTTVNQRFGATALSMSAETTAAEGGEIAKKQKKNNEPPPPLVIDVSKLDIRVGVIGKAWEHEEADRLFCEEIDIGEEAGPRQIASGLRAYYDVADLEGQRVLVLANLKKRKLVGFPSHGMVMCASTGEGDDAKVEFVVPPEDAAIGERVAVEGFDGEPATENQVIKKKMLDAIFPDLATNGDGVATYKGVPLSTSSGPCVAQNKMPNAEVS